MFREGDSVSSGLLYKIIIIIIITYNVFTTNRC